MANFEQAINRDNISNSTNGSSFVQTALKRYVLRYRVAEIIHHWQTCSFQRLLDFSRNRAATPQLRRGDYSFKYRPQSIHAYSCRNCGERNCQSYKRSTRAFESESPGFLTATPPRLYSPVTSYAVGKLRASHQHRFKEHI